MTSTEDLVRTGLADLAPRASADEAAYRGIGQAITRRRRQRAVARVAAVTLALVSVGGIVLAVDRNEPTDYSTEIDDTTTTVAMQPERITFGEATFSLPVGWDVRDETDTWMCVAPVRSGDPEPCGLRLTRGEGIVGPEGFGPYEDHGDWSWHTATDPMRCPDRPYDPAAPFDAVVSGEAGAAPVEEDERPVGDRTAVYDRWEAECTISDFTFSPQAWHLTDPEMLIVDVLDHPETDAILASFEFPDDESAG